MWVGIPLFLIVVDGCHLGCVRFDVNRIPSVKWIPVRKLKFGCLVLQWKIVQKMISSVWWHSENAVFLQIFHIFSAIFLASKKILSLKIHYHPHTSIHRKSTLSTQNPPPHNTKTTKTPDPHHHNNNKKIKDQRKRKLDIKISRRLGLGQREKVRWERVKWVRMEERVWFLSEGTRSVTCSVWSGLGWLEGKREKADQWVVDDEIKRRQFDLEGGGDEIERRWFDREEVEAI